MLKRLATFLKKQKPFYQVIEHKTVYTTFDLSQTLHEDLKTIGKTLLVQVDQDFVFAIVPGHRRINLENLKKLINKERKKAGERVVTRVKIATENQIKRHITKKMGALIPFGSLYKKTTYIDRMLVKNKKMILNAGSFTESIRITSSVFQKIENPVVALISQAK